MKTPGSSLSPFGLAKRLAGGGCVLVALAARVALSQGVTAPPAPGAESQPKLAPAAAESLGEKWVRLKNDDQGKPVEMQTAIVRYTGPGAPGGRAVTVDLIGAVHVGDAAYYAELNRRFSGYDALLYELVAPQGTVIPRGAKAETRNPLGALQGGMKSVLQLEHQLEKVDYTRPNFVHADMSPDEFLKSMNDRGESLIGMLLEVLGLQGQKIAEQGEQQSKNASMNAEILVALFAKDRPRRLKIIAAKQFDQMDSLISSLGGEQGSTIITGRNQKALEVLKQQLAAGKTHVGIFYGAAHLIDMHERLVKEFGLQPERIEWVTAWDLTK